jgi:site-specific DNA recombinase
VLFRLDSEQLAHRLAQAGDNGPLKKRLAEHQAQQARLQEIIDLYSTGELTFEEYRAAKTTARARLEALGREIDRSAVNSPLGGISLATTLQEAWEKHGLEWEASAAEHRHRQDRGTAKAEDARLPDATVRAMVLRPDSD